MEKPKIICTENITKQSMAAECDINKILARYKKTGRLPELIQKNPMYGDFSKPVDYQTAFEIVERAEMQFAELSADVRDRFHNSPIEFLAFVQDKNNSKELIDMGLATAKPENKPVPAPGPDATKTGGEK